MAKGKSITRETRLRKLKNLGMDYHSEEKYFSCKYCQVDINSPDHEKALKHVRSQTHMRVKSD